MVMTCRSHRHERARYRPPEVPCALGNQNHPVVRANAKHTPEVRKSLIQHAVSGHPNYDVGISIAVEVSLSLFDQCYSDV